MLSKRMLFPFLWLIVGMLAGSLVLSFVVKKRLAPSSSKVDVETLQKCLIVRFEDFPPWAHLHAIGCDYVQADKAIELTDYYAIYSPGVSHLWNRKPIVIENLPVGSTELRIRSRDGVKRIGNIEVDGDGNYHWRADSDARGGQP